MESCPLHTDIHTLGDEALILELRAHRGEDSDAENDAVQEMISRCTPEVDMTLRKTGIGCTDLPDLKQEVFLLVLRFIGDLKEPRAFHRWVKQIARRTALNFQTRHKSAQAVPFSALEANGKPNIDVEDEREQPLEQMLASEERRRLMVALGEMKPNDRLRLTQFYFKNMSLSEIVADGGGEPELPLGTVKRQLHDARKRLRSLMLIEMAD